MMPKSSTILAMTIKLSELKPQESAKVAQVCISNDKLRQRLHWLGLREGETILCLHKSPLGGVSAFEFSHGQFALEDALTELVMVTKDNTL